LIDLDPIDVELLRILQRDATLSNKQLSLQLNRSVAAIQERRRKLREHGYIKRVVAIVDRRKIDRSLVAFSHVLLTSHSRDVLLGFERDVLVFDEVMECMQLTGAYDFILRVAVRDMDAYNHFLREKLATIPNISTVQSFFVLEEANSDTAYPLP